MPPQYIYSVLDYGADNTGMADSTAGVRKAIAAAWANVQATNRRSVVYFPSGTYMLTGRTQIIHIPLSGVHSLALLGDPGASSRLQLTGNSSSGNWHMFGIDHGSNDIEFRSLTLQMTGITNPDPGDQNHIVQVGTDCSDIRFEDCEFEDSIGDGLRLLGEFGQRVHEVEIHRCRFLNCGRTSVSFQRWVQNVSVLDCYFTGGHDQQIDFEPTGTTLTATEGSTATILKCATAKFTTYGLMPGDTAVNGSENKLVNIVAIDSDTQITTTAGCTDWTGDRFRFPWHEGGHIIANNRFVSQGSNAAGILVALEEAFHTRFVNNNVEGTLYGTRMMDCLIAGNHFEWRAAPGSGSLIDLRFECQNITIADNDIVVRSNTDTLLRGISVAAQQGHNPTHITIARNQIECNTRTTAIYVLDPETVDILDNTIVLNTPGDTTNSIGIHVGAVDANINRVRVTGNNISARQGQFLFGIDFDAQRADIDSCLVGGGSMDGCGTAVVWREGTFPANVHHVIRNPPVLLPSLHELGKIVEPPSRPWLIIGGVGGAPSANGQDPAVFWGTGSPEGVLVAGVGSIALRRDGGAGTCLYVKESGTGNTGWVAK